jgi:hypothetical protein
MLFEIVGMKFDQARQQIVALQVDRARQRTAASLDRGDPAAADGNRPSKQRVPRYHAGIGQDHFGRHAALL